MGKGFETRRELNKAMAISPRKAQSVSTKAKRAYRLEFDRWVLQSMIGLLTVAGLGIFYLGYLTGQGSRRPVVPVLVSQQQTPTPPAIDNSALKPSNLSINQALSRRPVERYDGNAKQLQATTRLLESTKKLIANNQQQSAQGRATRQNNAVRAARSATTAKVKPSQPNPQGRAGNTSQGGASVATQPPPRKASSPKAASPPSTVKKGSPEHAKAAQLAQPRQAGRSYTVQVFASPQRVRATNLVSRLTSMKFEAVRLNQLQTSEGKVWHRVRVGRFKTRAQAKAFSKTIRKRTGLKDLRVLEF